MFRHIAMLLACVPVPALAGADEPEILARTSKWVVDYGRDACNMYAQFGTGDQGVVARFTRYEPADHLTIWLIGKRVRLLHVHDDIKLDFGLRGEPVGNRVLLGTVGKMPAMYLRSERIDGWRWKSSGGKPPPITPEQEAAVSGLTVAIRGKQPFRLDFVSLGKPLAALRKCVSDLVKSWGYDPEVQARLTRPVTPVGSPARWLSDDDYPIGALAMGQSGMVQFRLDVDAAGQIAGCYVLDRSNPDVFADLTCKAVTKRAKLQPALDAEGKPIRSYYVQSVRFLVGDN